MDGFPGSAYDFEKLIKPTDIQYTIDQMFKYMT